MVTISPKIGRAMANQLDRVNHQTLAQRLLEAEAEIERLRELVETLRQQTGNPLPKHGEGRGGDKTTDTMHNGRPVMPLQQAADRAGVNYYAARRYCLKGHWSYYIDANHRYHVYVDQPLTIPSKVTRRKN